MPPLTKKFVTEIVAFSTEHRDLITTLEEYEAMELCSKANVFSGMVKDGENKPWKYHYKLRSGMCSAWYVKFKDLPNVDLILFLRHCYTIALKHASGSERIDTVAGVDSGGLLPAFMISHYLSELLGRKLHYVPVTKSPLGFAVVTKDKQHVTGKKLLLVEDSITTGTSGNEAIDVIRSRNGKVVAVSAFCNRWVYDPPHEVSLVNGKMIITFHIPYIYVFSLYDRSNIDTKGIWLQSECIFCNREPPVPRIEFKDRHKYL